MIRRHTSLRRLRAAPEPDMTSFLNLMVVLVPFLLITAVFSRISIVELSLPSSAGAATSQPPAFRIEVIVRDAGLEITNGTSVIATLPKRATDAYDLERLGEMALALKRDHPRLSEASVLLEPDVAYDHLIQVMDVVRSAPNPDAEEGDTRRIALFPNISIGDAP